MFQTYSCWQSSRNIVTELSLVPDPPTSLEVQGGLGKRLQHYHVRFIRYKGESLWAYLLRLGFTGCCLTAAEVVTLSCAGVEILQMKHHHFFPSHFSSFRYFAIQECGKLSHSGSTRKTKNQKLLAFLC